MTYFVTGATGFIGRHLLAKLLARKGNIYCLVRKGSQQKFDALRESFGDDGKRLIAVSGDLSKTALGISPAQKKTLTGKIKHFFHLAAIYDLAASAESQHGANIDGTRHAVQLAEQIRTGCFHHTSSIAVAGLYSGVFREDMFAEAEDLVQSVLQDQARIRGHRAQGVCKRPYRIYRPAHRARTIRVRARSTRSTVPIISSAC